MRLSIIIALLLAFASPIQAAPSTPTVTGDVVHGQSVTISGTGFGTKTTAAPYIWDSVDGKYGSIVNGAQVPIGGGNVWGASSGDTTPMGDTPRFKTTNPRGKWTAKYTNTGVTGGDGRSSLGGRGLGAACVDGVMYVSWWMWSSASAPQGTGNSNKLTRFTQYGTSNDYQLIATPEYVHIFNTPDGEWTLWSKYYDPIPGVANTWVRIEVIIDNSVATNPHSTVILNGTTMWDGNADIASPVSLCGISSIGFDASNDTSPATIDYGEIYYDSTRSRVEICNNSVKANATHCEIQIPSAWNSNGQSITATVNQGTFADSSSAYIFVIDAAGEVSPGRSITFGAGGGDTTPATTTITSSDPLNVSVSSATVLADCYDETGVGGSKWTSNGVNPDATHGTACGGITSASCSVTGLSSGNNDVRVACYDSSGNYDASPGTLTVNYTPPAVTAVLIGSTCRGCAITH